MPAEKLLVPDAADQEAGVAGAGALFILQAGIDQCQLLRRRIVKLLQRVAANCCHGDRNALNAFRAALCGDDNIRSVDRRAGSIAAHI